MKILYYTDLFIPFIGGNESYLANVESRINTMGHQTLHITSKINNTPKQELMKWDGKPVPVKRSWIPFRKDFLGKGRYFFPFTSFYTAIKEAKNYDIIHATTFIAALSGWMVGKVTKKPVVMFAHELFGPLWKEIGENPVQRYIYPLIEKWSVRRYKYYATCSEYGKRTLVAAGANPNNITIINHGVDPQFNPTADGEELRKRFNLQGKLLFGFSGRLKIKGTGQSKGLPYLLEAAKIVLHNIPDSVFVLGGSDFEALEPLIDKMGIRDRIVYTGKLSYSDVPKFHAMCDVVCGASIAEGFGLFYAEASRCGRAVAATNAGAIPEVIVNDKTGLLAPAKDPKVLAANIITLLKDKDMRDKMGYAGAEYTKKFDWDKSAKEHLELYEKIIKEKK